MHPNSFIALSAQRLYHITLTLESDTLCRWIDPLTHTVNFTLIWREQSWWFTAENDVHLSAQRVVIDRLYPIIYHGEQCLLCASAFAQPLIQYFALSETDRVLIGRTQGDVIYDHPLISARHALLSRRSGQWWIEDQHSANGVYVNDQRIQSTQLCMGDCIDILGCRLLYGVNFLALYGTKSIKVKARLPPFAASVPKHEAKTPVPLSMRSIPGVEIRDLPRLVLKDPPALLPREHQPLLGVLGPALTMSIASVSSSLFLLQNTLASGQPATAAIPSLIMAGSMLLSTLAWPLWQRRHEKRRELTMMQQRSDCYDHYLADQQRCLEKLLKQQREQLIDRYVSGQAGSEVWRYDLSPTEMRLCIGIGNQSVEMPFTGNDHPLTIQEDALEQRKQEFLHQPCVLKGVPLLVTMRCLRCFTVKGSRAQQLAYARYVLLHHVLLYAPHTACVLIVGYEPELGSFPRFLPHQFNETGYRFICHDIRKMAALVIQLRQERRAILAISLAEPFTTFLRQNVSDLPIALLACHDSCRSADQLTISDQSGQWQDQSFQWQYEPSFDVLIHQLCNLRSSNIQPTFPKVLSFLQLYQVKSISQLQIEKRWEQRDSENSLQAQIGVSADGGVMTLDLHERAHGPHGIIAGMTGSGKSEWLITLLLSLAINYHPGDCAFVLIDYKGGGMAKALERLPHTVGIITNLDGSLIQRSLKSLDVELLRRQRLFVQVMEQMGAASMNIDIYQKLYHEHQVSEVIPHLVIVADEFAELKQQEPQFMEQLIRIARIGRSLGIHLLLATQKPSGIVDDQIWSNARFHVCLKVGEISDSMDMLKRKEGAQIKAVGRFYLQVGYDELFIQGQSAYAKVPYDPQLIGLGRSLVKEMDDEGGTVREWKRGNAQPISSEFNALVDELVQLAQKKHLFAPPLWLDPLPETLLPQKLPDDCFALADDPAHCRQFPVSIHHNRSNTIFFAQNLHHAGKAITAFLAAIIRTEAADKLHIVLIDGAQDLQAWDTTDAIYARCTLEEKANISFLMAMLKEEKRLNTGRSWLVVIHHAAAFLELFDTADAWLQDLAVDQGKHGIHVVLSATGMMDVRGRLLQQCENEFVLHMQDEQEVHSLVGSPWRQGNNALRAIWKQGESAYEVQFVQEDDVSLSKLTPKANLHMPLLEEFPTYSTLKAETEATGLILGRRLLDRKVLCLPFAGHWLITGNQYRAFFTLLMQIDEHEHWPIAFCDELTSVSDAAMILCALSPNELMHNLHHPFVSECMQNETVIWCGLGLDEYRYLWQLPPSLNVKSRQDAVWCKEEGIVFRRMIAY